MPKPVVQPKCVSRGEHFKGIYGCCGWNSGKLAFLLGCSVHFPFGNDDPDNSWTHSIERKIKLPHPINLGCRRRFISRGSLNYNSQNCVDKVKSLQRFHDAGIPAPRLVDPYSFKGKFLGRKNKSKCGRGITIYNAGDKIGEHDFFVELLSCKSEHRIHIFKGEVLCELNKRIKAGTVIHTLEMGCPLIPGTVPQRDKMVEYARRAVEAMQLDFGAVDLFVDTNDKIYVLEVNSDPGMPGIIGYLYAEKFREFFNIPKDLGSFHREEDGQTFNLDEKKNF